MPSLLTTLLFASMSIEGAGKESFKPPPIRVAEGFKVITAAAPPLVGYPMMACLDDQGRLYVAESDGRNLTTKAEIEKELPRFVRRLVDVDNDGIYDESTIFADKMTMPEGGLWHEGALYIISAPYLWRLEDTDDDGVADKREKILGYMEFDGRANQHGPYLGPNGRFYFSGGHFGYQFKGRDGSETGKSRAGGIFSCNPDGSDVRIEGQGGINPVEIVFTATGEMLSTCAIFDSYNGRHDALIHWVPGGLTQRVYGVPLVHETGYRLPALSRWGQVAPAGLVRYRGNQFGASYKGSLFACQFNTQKVVHVSLQTNGSTFTTEEQDFLSSTSIDFHPADILEDADGSLLLLDTGGWLSWGCPHSKIAKPQIKGAIYRILRENGPTEHDPRGRKLEWTQMLPEKATTFLADNRPAVRDLAANTLIKHGGKAVNPLIKAFEDTTATSLRMRQIWILSRIGSDNARKKIRETLASNSPELKQVAARSLGILKDKTSGPILANLLKDKNPAVIRAAATALGKIGERSAVPSLFKALTKDSDLYIQHAATYALIEISDAEATASYLKENTPPHWKKTALRVLDKMQTDSLVPSMVVPLLTSANGSVREEAYRVISTRPQWRKEILGVFSELLKEKEPDTQQTQIIESIVLGFAKDEQFHHVLGSALSDKTISLSVKVRLFNSIGFMETLPTDLLGQVNEALSSPFKAIKNEAIALSLRFKINKSIIEKIHLIADDVEESAEIRVAAMRVIAKNLKTLKKQHFEYLYNLVSNSKTELLLSGQAARALGQLKVRPKNLDQAIALCELIGKSSPVQLIPLLQPFVNLDNTKQQGTDQWSDDTLNNLGIKLASSLFKVRGSLHSSQLKDISKTFPSSLAESHSALQELVKNDAVEANKRHVKLMSLLEELRPGNASRGRALFYSNGSTCSLCHRAFGRGEFLGPDLSKIGSIRSRRDLLEAIVFPSSTIVNGYENYVIETDDGNSHLGLIQRETPDAVYLHNAGQREDRITRTKIIKMFRAPVSVMPAGLDGLLSRQQLADLIAFLEDCK